MLLLLQIDRYKCWCIVLAVSPVLCSCDCTVSEFLLLIKLDQSIFLFSTSMNSGLANQTILRTSDRHKYCNYLNIDCIYLLRSLTKTHRMFSWFYSFWNSFSRFLSTVSPDLLVVYKETWYCFPFFLCCLMIIIMKYCKIIFRAALK